jgi:hypothetical protein
MRAAALFSAAFVSIVEFGFGLIAPLTPKVCHLDLDSNNLH